MSDSDTQPSGVNPDKRPANHRQLFFVAAAVGAVVIIALLFTPGGQHTTTPPTPSPASPALVEPTTSASESPTTTQPSDEPQPAANEPASSEPATVTTEPLVTGSAAAAVKPTNAQSVDHAIIPADHSGPPWALNLISLSTPEHVPQLIRQIKALGFNPEMVEVIIDGRHWYRVRIKGFATISAARQAGQTFVNDEKFSAPWIGGY